MNANESARQASSNDTNLEHQLDTNRPDYIFYAINAENIPVDGSLFWPDF